ncbi:MAG TPA: acyclic terpene utilization AtuA family protein [Nocardioidaceae bacterium]|nr:acyclic terpene utilization AtuA family protein [Nocardioidaceae bacterium]
MSTTDGVLRVGNCSGFYGDRLSAMREMLEGGELDVLTGDYLAELTMLILGKDKMKDPALGYARTFVRQAEECMGLALERGVKIVANAGGLNPAGLADKLREIAAAQGLDPQIAYVQGDDLMPQVGELGIRNALTANAYLGAFGIAAALDRGADIVVTGRVTDASVVVGPAASHFGWRPDRYDELAGAMVAGHIIECGTQATGGNFSGFRSFKPDTRPLGFPIAEVAADGSSVITKHPGTGGVVTTDTVTAQLVYEIGEPTYLGPDVSACLDTVQLAEEGPDRVRVSGVRGEAPPATLKVCVNELGGFRNTVEFVLVGLDIDAKADWVRTQMDTALAAQPPAHVEWTLARTDREDASTEEAASCRLRCSVKDPDPDLVGKRFTAAAVELGLASYPGFTLTAPPAPASPYGVYRAEYVDRSAVRHTVVHPDGTADVIPTPSTVTPLPAEPSLPGQESRRVAAEVTGRQAAAGVTAGAAGSGAGEPACPPEEIASKAERVAEQAPHDRVTRRLPLGTFVHARSGDKGGDANVGLWVDQSTQGEARVAWLTKFVTPERIRELVPEAEDLPVDVYPLPNLGAVNVVLRGLLGQGVAASTRFDPQAKALGEWIRSRHVSITEDLL